MRFLIHDRDAKFPRTFDALLESDGINVIRTPNTNGHMERCVATVRRECLDRLFLGRHQLEYVLRVYVTHYNGERPHRALDLKARLDDRPPIASVATPHPLQVNRRDLVGGVIHEYELAAA